MECISCKADVRKTDKHCWQCGLDLTKTTHELEAQQLRDENTRLKAENETLKKGKVKDGPTEEKPSGIF